MTQLQVSDGFILVPHNLIERAILFCLGLCIGQYSKTCEQDCYPLKRRWKAEF